MKNITLKSLRRHMERFIDRKFFEKKMQERFGIDSPEFNLVMNALEFITEAREGTKMRKNGNSPLSHERESCGIADALGVNDHIIYIVLLLHDLVEDFRFKGWTFKRIEKHFDKDIESLVRSITKKQSKILSSREASDQTFDEISKAGFCAILVKYIERSHNLMNPYEGCEDAIGFKVQQTIARLLPLAEKHGIPTRLMELTIAELQLEYDLVKTF